MAEIVLSPPQKGICKCWALYLRDGTTYSPILYLQKPLHVREDFYHAFMSQVAIWSKQDLSLDSKKIFRGEADG